MSENKCEGCPKSKTLVSGWKCCMGNSCEIDVRNKTIDEIICILKHRSTTILENGYEYHRYDDEELDEIAEQMKEKKNV